MKEYRSIELIQVKSVQGFLKKRKEDLYEYQDFYFRFWIQTYRRAAGCGAGCDGFAGYTGARGGMYINR
jgi:hypothetical protein